MCSATELVEGGTARGGDINDKRMSIEEYMAGITSDLHIMDRKTRIQSDWWIVCLNDSTRDCGRKRRVH